MTVANFVKVGPGTYGEDTVARRTDGGTDSRSVSVEINQEIYTVKERKTGIRVR